MLLDLKQTRCDVGRHDAMNNAELIKGLITPMGQRIKNKNKTCHSLLFSLQHSRTTAHSRRSTLYTLHRKEATPFQNKHGGNYGPHVDIKKQHLKTSGCM